MGCFMMFIPSHLRTAYVFLNEAFVFMSEIHLEGLTKVCIAFKAFSHSRMLENAIFFANRVPLGLRNDMPWVLKCKKYFKYFYFAGAAQSARAEYRENFKLRFFSKSHFSKMGGQIIQTLLHRFI